MTPEARKALVERLKVIGWTCEFGDEDRKHLNDLGIAKLLPIIESALARAELEGRLDEAELWRSKCLPDYPPQPPQWGPKRIAALEAELSNQS